MAERMTHFEKWDASQRNGWHNRLGEPVAAPRMETPKQPKEYNLSNAQRQLDVAFAMENAAMNADPFAMLEAQMAIMPQTAQAEIRATLPGIYSWGEVATVFRDQQHTQEA